MNKKKLEIVSLVRINGKIHRQDEIDPEEFRTMVHKRVDEIMLNLGFVRDETA